MPLPPDMHVHTEWSWDAARGSMEQSCQQALDLGLPAIAFTEHADWVKVHKGQSPVDIIGYLDAVERCRAKFKNLRIRTGVELGEPHWFPMETQELLAAGAIDQVLGSVHCIRVEGEMIDASQFRDRKDIDFSEAVREFLRETLELAESKLPFETVAHLDYPKRYWKAGLRPYEEKDYEEEIRAVLKAAAETGRVLEVNTTRGHMLCPDLTVVRWWREAGGQAVQYGSDAHQPDKVAEGFRVATQMVQSAGFKPAADPTGLWRR